MADNPKSFEPKSWNEDTMAEIPSKVPSVYANNVSIGFSNWDAWIQFGELAGEREGKLLVQPRLRVVMSLEHTKAFISALQDSVSQFEEQFGEIKLYGVTTPETIKAK
ncbi:MAG TPA: DUF3467 domain-containing protein [Pyrinomonadaceae bacterium]|nr:DUF3467 domain-containing protein [Pyrinomonadaceae bacterium]